MRCGKRFSLAAILAALFFAAFLFAFGASSQDAFHFVILGDRTGETVDHVYEQIWAEAAKTNPAFAVTVGDTIQGGNDATADSEWREAMRIFDPYRRFPLYLTPGNHDIWSETSERLFRKYAGHPPHYSFDYGPAHFTILDNSRSDDLSADELAFLERDLEAHAAQPLKCIVSHRPSWIFNAAALNRDFPLHRLVRKYGVQYVIAGHLHELLHYKLDGVEYISMPSAGGHLRASSKYEDGWFFGFADMEVRGGRTEFRVKELGGRATALNDWGPSGLVLPR